MFKKVTILIVLLFILLTPPPTNAAVEDASSDIPELNPYCWYRTDCHNTRKQFLSNPPSCAGSPSCIELEQGFIAGSKDASMAPCVGGDVGSPEEWGRCLPAGTTKTEISFGGQDKFSNVGEFIVLMYKYLLTIVSIVAVVMIIIAGAQWVTSAGNSEAITSAKKRIGGAIIGLFIAYMSYFILNTINPALVNLRLPQVWLQNRIIIPPFLCSSIPGIFEGKPKVALVALPSEQNKPLPPPEQREYKIGVSESANEGLSNVWMACGRRFLVEGAIEMTCIGTSGCKPDELCKDWEAESEIKFFGRSDEGKHTGQWVCKKGTGPGNTTVDRLTEFGKDLYCARAFGRWSLNPKCW